MKKNRFGFLSLLVLLTLNISAQIVDCNKLIDFEGEFYNEETERLFTGTCLSYYENGIVSYQGTYMRGQPNGIFTWWHANGQKEKEQTFIFRNGNSSINGNTFVWFPNGQLKIKEKYENGLRHGKWYEYNSLGQQIRCGVYRHGECISGDEFPVVKQEGAQWR